MIDKKADEKLLRRAAEILHTEPEALPAVIAKFQRELEEIKRETARLKKQITNRK